MPVRVDLDDNSLQIGALANAAAKAAEKAGAEALRQGVQARAPEGTRGRLRARYRVAEAEGGTYVTNTQQTFYALFQEFGTVDFPAQPHFRPALEASKEPFHKATQAALRRALKI